MVFEPFLLKNICAIKKMFMWHKHGVGFLLKYPLQTIHVLQPTIIYHWYKKYHQYIFKLLLKLLSLEILYWILITAFLFHDLVYTCRFYLTPE